MSMFKKAQRSAAKLRLAIAGPSGSGKTYTALAIATHLAGGKPIAVIDTESGSASLYAGDPFVFDVAEMHAPFHPKKFISAIQEATDAGYGVVVLDSLSHAWMGSGGLLDIVDEKAKASQSKNSYMAWKEGTPIQNDLIAAIVNAPIHVIATMRSKTDYVLEEGKNGKQAPKKVGMKAIQRDDMEYEFTVVLQMTLDNDAIVEKSRCSALSGRVFNKPGKEVATILRDWLSAGAPVEQPDPVVAVAETAMAGAGLSQDGPDDNPFDVDALQTSASAIVVKLHNSDECRQWAVDNGYTVNQHSANTRWVAIVKEQFDGKYKPEKFKEIALVYVMHYLAKGKEAVAVGK